MKRNRLAGIGVLTFLCVFLCTNTGLARKVTVLVKTDDRKVQLSAVRTDGSVVAKTGKTKFTGKFRKDGKSIRKKRFTLDIPADEKVMFVLSKARGKHILEPALMRLKPKRVIAFWADAAKTAKETQFVVTDWSGEDPPIDLGTIKAFKGKLAISTEPDDRYNPLKQVDTDNDGIIDFDDYDDDNDGVPDTWDADKDGNYVVDDAEDLNNDTDNWPDIIDPDNDNDNQIDADDLDDNDNGILDVDEPDSDDDGIEDALDPDDDNDGIEDALDPDDNGDGKID